MKQLEIHEQFVKELRRVKLKGKHLQKLFFYVSFLLRGRSLLPGANDHRFKVNLGDVRDFHIGGDIVVLYRVTKDKVQPLRIGSHTQFLGV